MRRLLLSLVFLPIACSAAEKESVSYQFGQHYLPARVAQVDPNPKQTDVYEIFWYGCGHCARFDPIVEDWKAERKPADVNFTRIPASLGRRQGILHSKAYYTADALGVLDRMHPIIFDAIHKRRKQLDTESEIQDLFVANGVSADNFSSTFNSFIVESKVQQAEATIRGLGITSVPTMMVDHQYWTSSQQAGGFDGMLKVIDFLITKASPKS